AARSAAGRWVAEKLLGIDRRRTLPAWRRKTFSKRQRQRQPRPLPPSRSALLFVDTFTEHADPEIGLAAVDVLEASGIAVQPVSGVCCGRPLISQGLLAEARTAAAANADRLY